MNDETNALKKQKREKTLAQDRRTILNLPPEKALDAIAEHPYPVTLVQSMSEEDLYFLVHHIGPEDALAVLALASNEQWEYFLDMEVWDRDQMNTHQMTRWLDRLCKADADRFTHWIANEKQDEMALYLSRNVELHIREYEEDPGEIGDDFFSEDQTCYVRLRPYPKAQKKRQEERDLFIKDLLRRISVYDYTLYREFLLTSTSIIPSEAEEELFRRRNVRLAEKGLLPFDEAIGVYQPLKAADLLNRGTKAEAYDGRIVDTIPFPIFPEEPSEDANLFAQTLAQIHEEAALQKLQAEFAGLCNQVISADRHHIRDKEALSKIVQKVSDYISIGLEKVAMETEGKAPYANANLVQKHLLSDIFRVGYGCALALKWRAQKWHHASWYANEGLPLSFWGETFMGVLGGLLIKKPLYYDNYVTGVLYREFASFEDIQETETRLNHVIAFDDLLSLMNVEISPQQNEGMITYENVLLTLWANHHLNIEGKKKSPQPLTMDQFRRFFNELWVPDTEPRKITDTMREIFLGWLEISSGLAADDISERMAPALEQLFVHIESELGRVKKKDLDPRFISMFLLKAPT